MIRGTTPTHTFTTSIDLRGADKIDVTYKQGVVILAFTKADCVITDKSLAVTLTQEESFKFKTYGYRAEVQITAEIAGKVLKSNVMTVDVSRSLKEEAI